MDALVSEGVPPYGRDAGQDVLEQATDDFPAIVWITDERGSFSYLSSAWLSFTGQSRDDLPYTRLNAIHPDDSDRIERALSTAVQNRVPFHLTFRLRRFDGHCRAVIAAGAPRFDQTGTFLGHTGSIVDLNDRKAAEEKRERNDAQLQAIFDSAPDGIALLDCLGTIKAANPALMAILDTEKATAGANINDLLGSEVIKMSAEAEGT